MGINPERIIVDINRNRAPRCQLVQQTFVRGGTDGPIAPGIWWCTSDLNGNIETVSCLASNLARASTLARDDFNCTLKL